MATAAHIADAHLEFPPADLGGRCEIFPTSPLPGLDGPGGAAYVCRNLRNPREEHFAIVCDAPAPPRIESLATFRTLDHPSLVRVVDWGTVEWAPDAVRRFVICLERPSGRRLMDSLNDMREPMPEEQLVRGFLPGMLSLLKEASRAGLTCGRINPTNLYVKHGVTGSAVLGDCVSGPPGYGQPLLFETIERGMAQPAGRGPGSVADDLYALGVTLIVLMFGRNPLRGMEPEEVLQAKIERGTYGALMGGIRPPQNLVEPLRGLTTDDPKQRWTLNDLDLWLQGRRLSPKQPQSTKRAQRPLEFDGKELWTARAVAHALSRNIPQATRLIASGELDKWLRRALNDELRAERAQQAADGAGAGRPGSIEERTVARVCVALDPAGPIRYKGYAVMPDGIGPALAEATATGDGVQAMAEIVLFQMVGFWVNCFPDFRPDHIPLLQKFDSLRTLLEQSGPGFGVERLLYELCPAVPCMSLQVREQYVLSLAELMTALDQVAVRPLRGREPVDRHVAAYIGTHHRKLTERLLLPLSAANEPVVRASAMLALLVEVQRRYGPAKVPNLAGWLVTLLEPLIKRFHNRTTRERLTRDALDVAEDGALDKVLAVIDDPQALNKDQRGFASAMRQYEQLTQRIRQLRQSAGDRGGIAVNTGRQVAAVASSVVGMIVLVAIVIHMAGGI